MNKQSINEQAETPGATDYQYSWCEENTWRRLKSGFRPSGAVEAFAVMLARPGAVIGTTKGMWHFFGKNGFSGWDFHVVCVFHMEDGSYSIRDADAAIPETQPLNDWMMAQWPPDKQHIFAQPNLYPHFRVIPAEVYIDPDLGLRSDRSHMLMDGSTDQYQKPAPPWPAPIRDDEESNLRALLDMDNTEVPGMVYSFDEFADFTGVGRGYRG
jgi:hypothetical protein